MNLGPFRQYQNGKARDCTNTFFFQMYKRIFFNISPLDPLKLNGRAGIQSVNFGPFRQYQNKLTERPKIDRYTHFSFSFPRRVILWEPNPPRKIPSSILELISCVVISDIKVSFIPSRRILTKSIFISICSK